MFFFCDQQHPLRSFKNFPESLNGMHRGTNFLELRHCVWHFCAKVCFSADCIKQRRSVGIKIDCTLTKRARLLFVYFKTLKTLKLFFSNVLAILWCYLICIKVIPSQIKQISEISPDQIFDFVNFFFCRKTNVQSINVK